MWIKKIFVHITRYVFSFIPHLPWCASKKPYWKNCIIKKRNFYSIDSFLPLLIPFFIHIMRSDIIAFYFFLICEPLLSMHFLWHLEFYILQIFMILSISYANISIALLWQRMLFSVFTEFHVREVFVCRFEL